jgi:hypothetical protein
MDAHHLRASTSSKRKAGESSTAGASSGSTTRRVKTKSSVPPYTTSSAAATLTHANRNESRAGSDRSNPPSGEEGSLTGPPRTGRSKESRPPTRIQDATGRDLSRTSNSELSIDGIDISTTRQTNEDNRSSDFDGNSIGDDAPTDHQCESVGFENLPIEIRSKIWQETMMAQYIVIWQEWRGTVWRGRPIHHISRVNIPVAMHICHESRQEFLRYYTLVQFDNGSEQVLGRDRTVTNILLPTPTFYVNFAIDTLVFPGNEWEVRSYTLRETFSAMGTHFSKIRSIAISKGNATSSHCMDEQTLRIMSLLPLESIYILEGPPGTYEAARGSEVDVYDPSQRHPKPYLIGSIDGMGSTTDISYIDWPVYRTKLEEYVVSKWYSAWEWAMFDSMRRAEHPPPMPLKGILTYDSLTQPNHRVRAPIGEERTRKDVFLNEFCLGIVNDRHFLRRDAQFRLFDGPMDFEMPPFMTHLFRSPNSLQPGHR